MGLGFVLTYTYAVWIFARWKYLDCNLEILYLARSTEILPIGPEFFLIVIKANILIFSQAVLT